MSELNQERANMSDDQQQRILQWAFDQAPFGISVLDSSGHQLFGNPRYAELIGHTVATIEDLDVAVTTRPTDLAWTANYLTRLVTGELPSFETDKVFVRSDGGEQLVHLTTWPVMGEGRCEAIVGVITPVPPRAGLTDARMQKLLANIDGTIWLFDRDGNIVETSGRFKTTIGYPEEFWATRSVFDVVAPEDLATLLDLQQSLLENPGVQLERELRVLGADGSIHWIRAQAVNLLADPEVNGVLVTTQNVTLQHEMVQELAARTTAAEREAALRTRLVATVSHELRNPLHAMGGLAELLATSSLAPDAAVMAATLHRQVTALTAVLDDLLDSSRLDASGVSLRTNEVDLHALVTDVVAILSSVADNRPLSVRARIEPHAPSVVRADGPRLRQILSNLMGNAVKFTEQGTVELRVDVDDGGMLCFTVSDTGRGIAEEELATIFEPFTSASNSGVERGAGLGLTIVRQLVAAMDGTMSVQSVPGEGSVFTVSLPLERVDVPSAPSSPTAAPTAATVLVVEDNAVNQLLARNQLNRLGVECIVVGTGEEALERMAKPDPPTIVLMDFQLPGIDGLETTRRLRALEDTADVVIIGVTASAMAADRDACRNAGMDDFLAKPVSLEQLRHMLARWMPVHPAADTARPHGLDRDVLDTLADELGDAAIVESLVESYLSELASRSADIQRAAAAGELAQVRRKAHALKSSSQMLGLAELGELCRRLELLEDDTHLRELTSALPTVSATGERDMRLWLERSRALHA
jgi:PAS domain S-box-containing protein